MKINLSAHLERHRNKNYIWLLLALITLLTVAPFLVVTENGRLLAKGLTGLSLFACAAIISPKKMILTLIFLATVFFICTFQPDIFGSTLLLHLAGRMASLVFYTCALIVISVDVISGGKVDRNKLCGAACIYLLMGLLFSQIFQILSAINPAHFVVSSGATLASTTSSLQDLGFDLIYFSFVTLTTMGYGDILPATQVSRMLSAMEAVLGQIYLAVLVARLVALYAMTPAGRGIDLELAGKTND